MLTFRVSAEVNENREVVVKLPPETPTGKIELLVIVATENGAKPKRPRTSLADWAQQNAEDWGGRLSSEDVSSFTGTQLRGIP
ncbi:MAG: hypothetical protein U0793_24565 [Gemmataceae bacterium]